MIYLFQKIYKADESICKELLVKQSVKALQDPFQSFGLSSDWELLGKGQSSIHFGEKSEVYLP